MVTAIRLTVLTGPHKDRRFCFGGPSQCQAGRALDCFIRLCGTERDQLISRHHCQLDIDPPLVQVCDLGSSNGTYINGKKLDLRVKEIVGLPNSEVSGSVVNGGDLLTIGGTTLKVEVVDCPHALDDQDGEPLWKMGETAKKDCVLPC